MGARSRVPTRSPGSDPRDRRRSGGAATSRRTHSHPRTPAAPHSHPGPALLMGDVINPEKKRRLSRGHTPSAPSPPPRLRSACAQPQPRPCAGPTAQRRCGVSAGLRGHASSAELHPTRGWRRRGGSQSFGFPRALDAALSALRAVEPPPLFAPSVLEWEGG